MQARGHGRLVSSTESKADLKRARKEGKLSEAMLDRRMKLKRWAASSLSEWVSVN